jgi:hypothetical protein
MKENFEKLIEYIINDETEKAQELFHQYVVSQSREIYNELVAEDEMSDEEDEDKMEENIVDEYSTDETDTMMNDISADEEGMDQEDDDDMMGGDDDMMNGDDEENDMDDNGEEEAGIENRVVDLEDALDELKAEFDRLMADEAGEEQHSDMPDEGVVREYHEKVSVTHSDGTDSKGSKSPVAGKNDMGGTAKSIAQGGEEKGSSAPKSGDMGVVDPRAAGKTAFGKKAPAPVTKDQATGTKSPIAK